MAGSYWLPDQPHAASKSRMCAGTGASTVTGGLFFEIGTETDVLVEQPGKGRASFYGAVRFNETAEAGTVRRMRLIQSDGRYLVGVMVE